MCLCHVLMVLSGLVKPSAPRCRTLRWDVDGGDFIVCDAVLDDVDPAKSPHGAANRARVVAGEDGRRRIKIERRGMRLWDEQLLDDAAQPGATRCCTVLAACTSPVCASGLARC